MEEHLLLLLLLLLRLLLLSLVLLLLLLRLLLLVLLLLLLLLLGRSGGRDGVFRQVVGRRPWPRFPGLLVVAGGARAGVGLPIDVSQPSDLEGLRHFEQGAYLLLGHVYLPFVHEFDDGLQFRPFDVFEDDDRVLARIVEKQRLEVRAAGRKHHLVGLDRVAVAGQGDIHEGLALEKLVEDIGEVALVIVPAQTELLWGSHAMLHDAADSC